MVEDSAFGVAAALLQALHAAAKEMQEEQQRDDGPRAQFWAELAEFYSKAREQFVNSPVTLR